MELKENVQKILDEKVNPQLALHNGSTVVTDIEDGIVWIKFRGACASCVASSDTFDSVVKKSILEGCPGVKDVRVDDSVSEDLLAMARKILNKEI